MKINDLNTKETMTNEQIEQIKQYDEKMRHGYTVNGGAVTQLYNEVLGKNVAPTNCGSCIRRRIQEMTTAMYEFLEKQELEVKNGDASVVAPKDKPKKKTKKENGD